MTPLRAALPISFWGMLSYVSVSAGRFLRCGYMDLSDSLLIVRVDLPVRDIWEFHPVSVYGFAWNDEKQEGRYFTIEIHPGSGKTSAWRIQKDWSMLIAESSAEGASCSVCWILSGSRVKIKEKVCQEINPAHFSFAVWQEYPKVARTTRARSPEGQSRMLVPIRPPLYKFQNIAWQRHR